jgi:hypothetical protein
MWYLQYVRFHGMKHPGEMGEREVGAFLRHLAVERGVAGFGGTSNDGAADGGADGIAGGLGDRQAAGEEAGCGSVPGVPAVRLDPGSDR